MSLRVRTPTGTDRWESAHDERHWYDYTHVVDGDDLIVYLHTFRRVRMPAGNGQDHLVWKHHTTKIARQYAAGEWSRVSRARRETPPAKRETAPRLPRERVREGMRCLPVRRTLQFVDRAGPESSPVWSRQLEEVESRNHTWRR